MAQTGKSQGRDYQGEVCAGYPHKKYQTDMIVNTRLHADSVLPNFKPPEHLSTRVGKVIMRVKKWELPCLRVPDPSIASTSTIEEPALV
jgi:hypothetical protein